MEAPVDALTVSVMKQLVFCFEIIFLCSPGWLLAAIQSQPPKCQVTSVCVPPFLTSQSAGGDRILTPDGAGGKCWVDAGRHERNGLCPRVLLGKAEAVRGTEGAGRLQSWEHCV